MSLRPVADARRWAGLHCFGTYNLLFDIHASYEDLLGALDANQLQLARYSARDAVMRCLAVRAMAAGGFPPEEFSALNDPFAGLPDEVVTAAPEVARRVVRAPTIEAARVEAAGVHAYVRALERDLGFRDPPASIRLAEGLFPALRLTRTLLPLNRAAQLPLAIPSAWLADDTGPSAGPANEGN